MISIFFSQSIGDTVRSLDFLQWMEMLKKVFNASLRVLRRMEVCRITTVSVCVVAFSYKDVFKIKFELLPSLYSHSQGVLLPPFLVLGCTQ